MLPLALVPGLSVSTAASLDSLNAALPMLVLIGSIGGLLVLPVVAGAGHQRAGGVGELARPGRLPLREVPARA